MRYSFKVFEQLTVMSDFSLKDFSEKIKSKIGLTDFEFDSENETEWCIAYDEDNIELNISKPYEEGTLQEWDKSVPEGCNFGLCLISSMDGYDYNDEKYDQRFILDELIPKYLGVISEITQNEVFYHRGNFHKEYIERIKNGFEREGKK